MFDWVVGIIVIVIVFFYGKKRGQDEETNINVNNLSNNVKRKLLEDFLDDER